MWLNCHSGVTAAGELRGWIPWSRVQAHKAVSVTVAFTSTTLVQVMTLDTTALGETVTGALGSIKSASGTW